jgi:hypothetical protein
MTDHQAKTASLVMRLPPLVRASIYRWDGRGLFQTNDIAGRLLFISMEDGERSMSITSACNNEEGKQKARQIAQEANFVCWAVDPWTGHVNVEFV